MCCCYLFGDGVEVGKRCSLAEARLELWQDLTITSDRYSRTT